MAGIRRCVPFAILVVAWLSGCGPVETEVGKPPQRVANWFTERRASPIDGVARFDTTGGSPLALGLFVRCEIPADSAGILMGRATLWQRGGDALVATANSHGSDFTNSSLHGGTPVRVEVTGAGPAAVEFWFPGSEIHHEGHTGAAAVLIEIWRDGAPQGPVRYYRCEIPKLEPPRFVRRLPGSHGPWPR